MKAVRQPREQTHFGGRKIHTGDPDLGKSQFNGPGTQLGHQLRTIDLTAVEHHPPIVESTVTWRSEDETHDFAARMARCPGLRSAFIELRGDLGAGKTTFVRHLLHALGVAGRIKSPTYTVAEPHEAPGPAIWHFDFFRFDDPGEWEDAGFRDLFAAQGLKLVEWPEKAAGLLPRADLVMHIQMQPDDSRRVVLQAQTPLGRSLLA
jgi:tRNA threonylcarbamoyladenosine biosynthesis protein TsaE